MYLKMVIYKILKTIFKSGYIKSIRNGDIIKIKNEEYDVIDIQYEDEIEPPDYNSRELFVIYVNRSGNNSFYATHKIVYYLDSRELIFRSNKEGDELKFKLRVNDIKIISKYPNK